MKIKTIKGSYECQSCGSIIEAKRDIIIDRYLDKKIEIPKTRCKCGGRNHKLIDIQIEDKS